MSLFTRQMCAVVLSSMVIFPPWIWADCRVVQKVVAVQQHHQVSYNIQRQVAYDGHQVYATLIAVEQPYKTVQLLYPELREQERVRAEDKALRDEVRAARAEIKALREDLKNGKTAQPGSLENQAPPASPTSQSDTDKDTALTAKVIPILKKNCLQCHKGDAASGKPPQKYFEADGSPLPEYPAIVRFFIESVINDDTMPPKGHAKVSAEDYLTIRQWMEMKRFEIRKLNRELLANPVQPAPDGELK